MRNRHVSHHDHHNHHFNRHHVHFGKIVALIGNPNCGKTTIFNFLTNSDAEIGNWTGVTVESLEKRMKGPGNENITIVDLPGIYSLAPFINEEAITTEFLKNHKVAAIINVIDASNLEKNLYLTTQILELNIPTLLILNMIDVATKMGKEIDEKALSKKLGSRVIKLSIPQNIGVEKLTNSITSFLKESSQTCQHHHKHLSDHDHTCVFGIDQFSNENEEETILSRYAKINKLLTEVIKTNSVATLSDKIDKIVLNKWLAFPIFLFVISFIYYFSISVIGKFGTFLIEEKLFGEFFHNGALWLLTKFQSPNWLRDLVTDGIINGISTVASFIPQLFVLFFMLGFLQECGYMARIAFITDKFLSKFGFSGRSFIPLILSSGCGVSGIMACRTIEDPKERKITMMISTFVPCSAKLPIIALISSIIFNNQFWVVPSIYAIGIMSVIVSGLILKTFKIFGDSYFPFIIEVPKWNFPSFSNNLRHSIRKTKIFIVKTASSVFFASILIWFLSNFNISFKDGFSIIKVPNNQSILSNFGSTICGIFRPLGFGTWQATVAIIAGLAAKENIVSSLAILMGGKDGNLTSETLKFSITKSFTPASAYAFIVFNTLCIPCIAAVSALKNESGNNLMWTLFSITYQTLFAYAVSYIIYRLLL